MNIGIIDFPFELVNMTRYLQDYPVALNAMELAANYHTGTRKDGLTPEFSHQLTMVKYLKSFFEYDDRSFTSDVYSVAFLHDVLEDYPQSCDVVTLRSKFGLLVAESVYDLTRQSGQKNDRYYKSIEQSEYSIIVKGADRLHNLSTMVDVFSKEKQRRYIKETEEYIIPMLKRNKDITSVEITVMMMEALVNAIKKGL